LLAVAGLTPRVARPGGHPEARRGTIASVLRASHSPLVTSWGLSRRARQRVLLASFSVSLSLASTALVGCRSDRTAHVSSRTQPNVAAKQQLLERYVTFRRTYLTLDYQIDFDDDTSFVPGPSTTRCDVRVHATIPTAEAPQWIAGLEPDAAPPTAARPSWIAAIPNAPVSVSGFTWYRDKPSPSSLDGNSDAGRRVGLSPDHAEVLYRLVCTPN
jgi:hypothetical protein